MINLYDVAIIGGGIVGLSVAYALQEKYSHLKIALIEKEKELAYHQTGRNSGVIHSGIYYKPGSLKAKLAKKGSESLVHFCKSNGIQYEICGKVIVATDVKEIPLLHNLYKRGLENELPIQLFTKEQLKEREPYVNGLEAIYVPTAGIVDYKGFCKRIGELILEKDNEILLDTEVCMIHEHDYVTIETKRSTIQSRYLINCAGLHSDRIARLAGYHLDMKIVPFRGEYYQLVPEKRFYVNHLIYPVPNPNFPFLGVHFTRMINGEIEAGPNAVLAFKREGYLKRDFSLKDFQEVMGYRGFWKLASKYYKEGMEEMIRSFSKRKFVESLQKLIPDIKEQDLVSADAGVRAQALRNDGTLVEDFHMIRGKRSFHVCNAPSPAATASLEIGNQIAEFIPEL